MGTFENKRVIVHNSRGRKNKRRRIRQIRLKIALLALAVFAIGVAIWAIAVSGKTKIDLREQTEFVIEGYNGSGSIRAVTEATPGYEGFYTTVAVEFDKKSDLSNGESVTATYTYDKEMAKELGLRVKARPVVTKIDNLPDCKEYSVDEIFANVDVAMEGMSPLVTAELINNNTADGMDLIEYSISDEKEYYSNGDVITLQATMDDELMRLNAVSFAGGGNTLTKEYVVESSDEYIMSADELPSELLAEMKQKGASMFTGGSGDANEFGLRIFSDAGLRYDTDSAGKYTFRWNAPTYISAYFAHVSDEHLGENGTHINDVKLVYDVTISQSNGESVSSEAVVCFRDIVKHADGTVEVNFDEGKIVSCSRRDGQIKNIVSSKNDETYTSNKIE